MKISGVYKITNKITGEFYIGSSSNIKERWGCHKSISTWKYNPGMLLYIAFQQYGLDNFDFEIIEQTDDIKNREQYFIDLLRPAYNTIRASGHDLDKNKASNRKANKKYRKSEKGKSKYNIYQKEYMLKWHNRICLYEGKEIKLQTLAQRFRKDNIPNPTAEAKKYLIEYN